jgi:hypothetical protein
MSSDQLKAILEVSRQDISWEASEPPTACPIDGSLLDVRDNVRNCPMGNYRWPDTT